MANPLFDNLFQPLMGRTSPLLLMADGSRITGDAFYAMVMATAGALVAAGVHPGDRVAAQVTKSPAALALYGACVAVGAVFLPLNTAYTPAEIAYFLTDAEPALFVCDTGAVTLADLQGHAPLMQAVPRGTDDLAALLYTSGTTGRSKGAMLSQGNLLSNARVLVEAWRFTETDVLLHALPIFHTHGLFVASNVSLLSGGAMIFLPGFDAEVVLRLMPQATVMMGVPTFYTRLLPMVTRQNTAHMRLFVSGSAPLLTATHQDWAAQTGHHILERYGMTETNMNTSNPYAGDRRAGTVGLPLHGVELRLRDGVIEVRGPNVFQGYWRMPEKTAEELRADGWFITGDVGVIDADGYVTIAGRAKDLVITGGYNVYPREVEMALDALPGVVESAVIGVPHADLGEAVFAVVVARGDVTGALAEIAPSLARFKQPRGMVVVDSLPRNAMGKVQKNVLRARYNGWFG
jgi:malonyl-CoA/methylmalonyl-CoA synthetase